MSKATAETAASPPPPLIFERSEDDPEPRRDALRAAYRVDERQIVQDLLTAAALPTESRARVAERATAFVEEMRRTTHGHGGLDTFLHEYSLSTEEGIVLMCLAEALLRIPDADTADRLIRDKIAPADWAKHLWHSESLLVNASTWALMLTGRVLSFDDDGGDLGDVMRRLIARGGEPIIRQAMVQSMRIMGRQFVMGRTIEEALERAKAAEERGYRYSYDMLGEAAKTAPDAERYFEAYDAAIGAIGAAAKGRGPIEAPGISVKLSALHPRYEHAQRRRVLAELVPRLTALAAHAKEVGIGLTVDAEEADRLELSLDVIQAVSGNPRLADWEGLGLAIQAYQKRAPALVDWLAELARRDGRRLMVRLVKGAYWDTEIKRAQERGLDGYPVFTRKTATDMSYIACARKMLAAPDAIYAQFATHNALSLATVMELAGNRTDYEFQRLHGMGEDLYRQVVGPKALGLPCRVYAPVGSHEDLLPYLVRRLLENGANTSFVNRIVDEDAPIGDLVTDPVESIRGYQTIPHPKIPLPADLYGEERRNSAGIDLSDPLALDAWARAMQREATCDWSAGPIVGGREGTGPERPVHDPADRRRQVGAVRDADPAAIADAFARAAAAAEDWDRTPAEARAAMLERAADLYEANAARLMALCVREAGKSIPDSLNEVREAVDFLRYYALQARRAFGAPTALPGPTGEANRLSLHGRGPFVCISPWNFPIAIFTGQVAAALAAGNPVLAKPAEQTSLVAAAAVRLLHEAGVPGDVLQFLPGDGASVGSRLVGDPRLAGVAFTGSNETAGLINRGLAERDGPIVPLIAETGGQNAMIVDSSALSEQVVTDVVQSAFNSAGQRCSALRVLYLQEDIADGMIEMLSGAMAELSIGDPGLLSTDVGPVIDADARAMLEAHVARMTAEARLLATVSLPPEAAHGTFVAPYAFEIDGIERLEREVFGPVLHVVRYDDARLDDVIDAINATGYGLTLGVHSRIDSTIEHITRRLRVGNAYVNRNIVGAVVGVQPFGGEGRSGTGPKAGGPHYLYRFATERALSVNTTATGGNAALMTLEDD